MFAKYKLFVSLEQPLVICEGKTDSVYLKQAIRCMPAHSSGLGAIESGVHRLKVSFWNYESEYSRVLGLSGGSSELAYFFNPKGFQKDVRGFASRPLRHPVIVLIDNDDGARGIFKMLVNVFKIDIGLLSSRSFYRITENLYLVKTVEQGGDGMSCIEDCFTAKDRDRTLDGKVFNPKKDHGAPGQYGKYLFAEKVVRANASSIDFSGFGGLLDRIASVIADYRRVPR